MQHRVANRPPFGIELRFDRSEIDQMCVDELEKAGAFPAVPSPVKMESFIGKHFCNDYRYKDLPEGVLGVTAFKANGGIKFVGVSNKLDDDCPSADRRIRSTWAHEAGHCMLYPILFMRDPANRTQAFGEQGTENVTPPAGASFAVTKTSMFRCQLRLGWPMVGVAVSAASFWLNILQ